MRLTSHKTRKITRTSRVQAAMRVRSLPQTDGYVATPMLRFRQPIRDNARQDKANQYKTRQEVDHVSSASVLFSASVGISDWMGDPSPFSIPSPFSVVGDGGLMMVIGGEGGGGEARGVSVPALIAVAGVDSPSFFSCSSSGIVIFGGIASLVLCPALLR